MIRNKNNDNINNNTPNTANFTTITTAATTSTFLLQIAKYECEGPREEQYQQVVEQLQRVVAENQQLRDSNDELLSQLDSLPLRLPSARARYRREGVLAGVMATLSSLTTLGAVLKNQSDTGGK